MDEIVKFVILDLDYLCSCILGFFLQEMDEWKSENRLKKMSVDVSGTKTDSYVFFHCLKSLYFLPDSRFVDHEISDVQASVKIYSSLVCA